MDGWFQSDEMELAYLRQKVKTTYRNARVRPENCADAKNLLKGIRDDLKPYYDKLEQYEKSQWKGK